MVRRFGKHDGEKLYVDKSQLTLDVLLSDTRRTGIEVVYQTAAYLLLHGPEAPTTADQLAEDAGIPRGALRASLRTLKQHDYLTHESPRPKRHCVQSEQLAPTDKLIAEGRTSIGLQNEIMIRDIREQTGETRAQVIGRALDCLFPVAPQADQPGQDASGNS